MFNADVTYGPAGSSDERIGCRGLAVVATCLLALLASVAVAPSASANPCLGEEPTAPICDEEPVVENYRPTIRIVSPVHRSSSRRDQLVHFGADANDHEDGVPQVTWLAYRCAFVHELGCTRSASPARALGQGTDLHLPLTFLDLGTTFGSSTWSYYDADTGVYEIEATATDSGGLKARHLITISITREPAVIMSDVLPVNRCPPLAIC